MSHHNSDFKKRVLDAAPAPHDETPSFKRFSAVFSPLSILFTLALAYALSIAFASDYQSKSDALLSVLPITKGRIFFLHGHGAYSEAAYVATIVCAAIAIPMLVAVNGVFYLTLVALPGQCRGVNRITFLSLLYALCVVAVFTWIIFISVPSHFEPARPGLAVILFWPVFPALGALFVPGVSFVVFSVLVGLLKLAFRRIKS